MQTFFLTVNWGTLGANQAAAYPEDHFFFLNLHRFIIYFLPPLTLKKWNKQTNNNQSASIRWQAWLCPPETSDPLFPCAIVWLPAQGPGRALVHAHASRDAPRSPISIGVGTAPIQALWDSGLKRGGKKRSEKHLCVTLMLWYFEFGPGTSETKWAEFFSPLLWQLQRCQVDKRQGSRGELSTSTPMPVSQQELVLRRQKFVLSSSDRTRDSFFSFLQTCTEMPQMIQLGFGFGFWCLGLQSCKDQIPPSLTAG